ncbi:hypothetical protein K493DRAFT_335793 [Basidiobolus meristosporus CBS 931.73]|uniref:RRM domain-containing protein n=1 Tax=Basidiobolus meristosporus CBS 931.73 TaxID=1314790 RepID=A0A1Y1YP17_9FUNG|nr:hypothetical protein K493DRAFT_335793 [Basidiobolus meristosporus CBS 931.73]|eukprot:ORX99324.1 hypothetical protein K493DRAFT_335793 [Basidiobolus meristosporus CBS 931.73]
MTEERQVDTLENVHSRKRASTRRDSLGKYKSVKTKKDTLISDSSTIQHRATSSETRPALTEEQRKASDQARAYIKEIQLTLKKTSQNSTSVTDLRTSETNNTRANPSSDMKTVSALSRIYVGSIYFELSQEHIRAVFSQFGYVKNISMSLNPITGKHKGFCFIEFETPEAAELALETMNGAELGGRQLKVGRPNNYSPTLVDGLPNKPATRIYVANISEFISEENLASLFEAFGALEKCILIPDLVSKKHKGYGFVEFQDEIVADNAVVAMNGFELGGLSLHVCKAIVGGPLGEGMEEIKKITKSVLATQVPEQVLHAAKNINNSIAGQMSNSMAAKIAAKIVTRGRQTMLDSVVHEEHVSISGSQRYAIMRKLARSDELSPVIMIKNAVTVSEVDDELKTEFSEECSKFGSVVKVLVQPEDEAPTSDVRIFVQFSDGAAAGQAKLGLNGRWFGGKQIQAVSYEFRTFQAGNYLL